MSSVPKKKQTLPPTPLSSTLFGVFPMIHDKCLEQNLEFMRCKDEVVDPEKCLDQGKNVKLCVEDVIRTVNAACGGLFEDYRQCLYSTHNDFSDCREFQKKFYDCWDAYSEVQAQSASKV